MYPGLQISGLRRLSTDIGGVVFSYTLPPYLLRPYLLPSLASNPESKEDRRLSSFLAGSTRQEPDSSLRSCHLVYVAPG